MTDEELIAHCEWLKSRHERRDRDNVLAGIGFEPASRLIALAHIGLAVTPRTIPATPQESE